MLMGFGGKLLAVKYLMRRTLLPKPNIHKLANSSALHVNIISLVQFARKKKKTNLVNKGSKAVVEVLDLIFLLGTDKLDVGVDL